ncbi:hypothetical protein SLEP1_g27706 [Rubroshorea leprosula]|uniref:Uncharacterized protein n=1 Tax=Rubroshorea leprosula TaxID=152421 RepID=A0AAV5K3X9_9ROSI|nr:hypothetical protein SLEP1_g27706 [Rubroshorea leprosula]
MKEKKAPGCEPASWVPREPNEVRTQAPELGLHTQEPGFLANPGSRVGFAHPGAWVPREPSSWVCEVRTQLLGSRGTNPGSWVRTHELGSHTQEPGFLVNPARGFARCEPKLQS